MGIYAGMVIADLESSGAIPVGGFWPAPWIPGSPYLGIYGPGNPPLFPPEETGVATRAEMLTWGAPAPQVVQFHQQLSERIWKTPLADELSYKDAFRDDVNTG